MRVLFVNQYFPPDVSATAYLLGELAEDLSSKHDVWVVAGRPSYNPEVGTFQPKGVHLKRTWSTSFRRAGLSGRLANYGTFVLSSLVGGIRAPRPDVVVAMTDPPVIGLIGMLVAQLHRVPFVYVCEDIFPDVGIALRRVDNPLVVALLRRLNRVLRRKAAKVVAIGRDMREKLINDGVPEDKVILAPNWASEAMVEPAVRDRARAEMGWDGKFVVMHAGNVGLAQDLMTLIDAAEATRDHADIEWVIFGEGAARPMLEAETSRRRLGNVRFLPYEPKDSARALIAAADLHSVTLAPGLWGSVVPSKIYGILALGLPFVAAVDEGSEVDLIAKETGAGIRVDPGDGRALAAAVLSFAAGDADPIEAGLGGRQLFEHSFARSIGTARYLRLLEALAE